MQSLAFSTKCKVYIFKKLVLIFIVTFKYVSSIIYRASLMAQQVKNLPAMQEIQEMWVQFLGQEDPLKKEMATSSSILAWEVLWTEDPGGLQSMGLQRLDMN